MSRRRTKKADLITPVAVLFGLLAFSNLKKFEVVAIYAAILLVAGAAVFVIYTLLRKRAPATFSLSQSTPSTLAPTRTPPPAMDALDREFERRHSLPTEEAKLSRKRCLEQGDDVLVCRHFY
jgi:hypothetical protein